MNRYMPIQGVCGTDRMEKWMSSSASLCAKASAFAATSWRCVWPLQNRK